MREHRKYHMGKAALLCWGCLVMIWQTKGRLPSRIMFAQVGGGETRDEAGNRKPRTEPVETTSPLFHPPKVPQKILQAGCSFNAR